MALSLFLGIIRDATHGLALGHYILARNKLQARAREETHDNLPLFYRYVVLFMESFNKKLQLG